MCLYYSPARVCPPPAVQAKEYFEFDIWWKSFSMLPMNYLALGHLRCWWAKIDPELYFYTLKIIIHVNSKGHYFYHLQPLRAIIINFKYLISFLNIFQKGYKSIITKHKLVVSTLHFFVIVRAMFSQTLDPFSPSLNFLVWSNPSIGNYKWA